MENMEDLFDWSQDYDDFFAQSDTNLQLDPVEIVPSEHDYSREHDEKFYEDFEAFFDLPDSLYPTIDPLAAQSTHIEN